MEPTSNKATKQTPEKQAAAPQQEPQAQQQQPEFMPYQSAEEYLDDVLALFLSISCDVKEGLKKIEKRCQNSTAKIPFEEELKKFPMSRLERFCIYKVCYETLFQLLPPSPKSLFKALFKISSASEAAQIALNRKNIIYESKILAIISSGVHIKNDMLDKLLNIHFFSRNGSSETEMKKDDPKNKLFDSPIAICEALDPYVISQKAGKEGLATAIYEHFLRCRLAARNHVVLDKVNVLMWGPTGTGKTYLCRTLANLLNMPFYIADASQFTDTGYVGPSVDSVLIGLAGKIKDMGSKFPPSIIYIDEIDKICFKNRESGGNDVSGKSVQEELLKLLESDRYTTSASFRNPTRTYDISNVLFIAGGAFEGLDKIVTRHSGSSLGFIRKEKTEDTHLSATTEDLVEYGFMPELLGRFTKWVQLENLSERDLMDILSKSKDSPISQYKAVFKEAGIKLTVPEVALRHIAQQAIKKGTGARGLKNVLSNLLGQALYECKKNGKKTFSLKVPKA